MAPQPPERVQLCGAMVIERDGQRWEARLPGRQGRLLFAYLAINRHRTCSREELSRALWGDHVPPAGVAALNTLISKLRGRLGPETIDGRTSLRLILRPDAWVDVEVAEKSVHKAESRVALHDWTHAWGPALAALFITDRLFLPDDRSEWVHERRAELEEIHVRALEAYAAAGLGTGGTELAAAVRAGRKLIRVAPLRENGYRLLMEALAAQGNIAEALVIHTRLCHLLREELGVSPSAATRALHETLLHN